MLKNARIILAVLSCCCAYVASAETFFVSRESCEKACSQPCRPAGAYNYGCDKTIGHFDWVCHRRCRSECIYMILGSFGWRQDSYWCRELMPKQEYCLRYGIPPLGVFGYAGCLAAID
ncbi:hypothetical protein AAVH_24502 [Aphelenchoides avenae]|nr:hypothetical protein AAVH_24502 [Aphelenchus avenae]